MGTNNFTNRSNISSGRFMDPDQLLQVYDALDGTQVPRLNGLVTPGQDLGTPITPFGTLYIQRAQVAGRALDIVRATRPNNAILDGKTSPLSRRPDFLRPEGGGSALSCQILAGPSTPLSLNIRGKELKIEENITINGLQAPEGTNTERQLTLSSDAISNLSGIRTIEAIGGRYSKGPYVGRVDQDPLNFDLDVGVIPLGSVGTKARDRAGTIQTFKFTDGDGHVEYFSAILNFSSSPNIMALSNIQRAPYFNSLGNWIRYGYFPTILQNKIIMIGTAYVFIRESNPAVPIISYNPPYFSKSQPSSPAPVTGDQWFNLETGVWNSYDGSTWAPSGAILIGQVAVDTSVAVGARCQDIYRDFRGVNNISIVQSVWDPDNVMANLDKGEISVAGELFTLPEGFSWDMGEDIPSPLTKHYDTVHGAWYTCYLSHDGGKFILPRSQKTNPYAAVRRDDLGGWYAPHEYWRAIGDVVLDKDGKILKQDVRAWGFQRNRYWSPNPSKKYKGQGEVDIDELSGSYLRVRSIPYEDKEIIEMNTDNFILVGNVDKTSSSRQNVFTEKILGTVYPLEKSGGDVLIIATMVFEGSGTFTVKLRRGSTQIETYTAYRGVTTITYIDDSIPSDNPSYSIRVDSTQGSDYATLKNMMARKI